LEKASKANLTFMVIDDGIAKRSAALDDPADATAVVRPYCIVKGGS
jgi:hypothetical protein